jgi:hypothetical protein
VLILSGEGTQTQTIEALRLGADDYVRKEDVERELADRLRAVLQADQQATHNELLAVGSTLVAVPLKRYLAATDPVPRLKRLVELYEALLRLGGLLVLADLRHLRPELPEADRLSIRPLMSPAMGTWHHVCAAAGPLLPASRSSVRLAASFETKPTERIIKARNDLAHAGDPSDAVARELLENLEDGVHRLLRKVRHVPLDIVVPTGLRWDGSQFDVVAVELRGESVALPVAQRRTSQAPIAGRAYAISDDISGWTALHPLLVAEPGREPGVWEIFVFDGFGNRNANPRDDVPLRYLSIWSRSREHVPSSTCEAAEIRGIASDWA